MKLVRWTLRDESIDRLLLALYPAAGIGLVAVATFAAHANIYDSALEITLGVFLPWVSGMAAAAIGLSQSAIRRPSAPRWGRDTLIIGILLTVALLLRLIGLAHCPDGMPNDEALMAKQAQHILDGHSPNPFHVAVVGWMAHPNVYFYGLSAALRLFGWNLFGLRFVSAILGAGGVVAVYLLARSMFGRQEAWISALFVAGWGLAVHFSRLGLNNSADPLFGALVIWGLHRGLVHGHRGGFVVAGLTLGISLYLYHGSHLLLLVVPLVLAVSGLKRLRRRWKGLLVFALCFLLAFGPLLFTFITDSGQLRSRYKSHSVLPRLIAGEMSLASLWPDVLRASLAFVYTRDTGYFYRPDTPLLGPFSGFLFVLGAAIALWHWRQPRYLVLLAWIALTTVFGGWLLDITPQYQRYLIAVPAVALLVGRTGVVAIRWAARRWRWLRAIRRPLVAVSGVAILAINAAYYFGVYSPSGAFYWDRTTELANRAGCLMADVGPSHATYFFNAPDLAARGAIETVRFHAPGIHYVDVDQCPVTNWSFVQEGRGALFIVLPTRASDLDTLKERYPGGKMDTVLAHDGTVLFFSYRVDPGATGGP
jgi:4-amino-4-deoxy-L-arabinose transferase-like glycosyltransferase